MPLRECEAIVLRCYPLGEGDRLVSFLSRSAGRLRGVAAGARRPKSRFGSTLEPLSYIRIWFFERETRELVRINQCDLIESFLEAQEDYACGLALALISEVTEAVLPEREASEAAFRLVLATARTIKATRKTELPLVYFNLWTARLAGWLPDVRRCGRCEKQLGTEGAYASVLRPGIACRECRLPGMRAITAESMALATQIQAERLERLAKKSWPAGAARGLSEYLLDVIEHQIEKKLTTRKMLESET